MAYPFFVKIKSVWHHLLHLPSLSLSKCLRSLAQQISSFSRAVLNVQYTVLGIPNVSFRGYNEVFCSTYEGQYMLLDREIPAQLLRTNMDNTSNYPFCVCTPPSTTHTCKYQQLSVLVLSYLALPYACINIDFFLFYFFTKKIISFIAHLFHI